MSRWMVWLGAGWLAVLAKHTSNVYSLNGLPRLVVQFVFCSEKMLDTRDVDSIAQILDILRCYAAMPLCLQISKHSAYIAYMSGQLNCESFTILRSQVSFLHIHTNDASTSSSSDVSGISS